MYVQKVEEQQAPRPFYIIRNIELTKIIGQVKTCVCVAVPFVMIVLKGFLNLLGCVRDWVDFRWVRRRACEVMRSFLIWGCVFVCVYQDASFPRSSWFRSSEKGRWL